MYKLMVYNDSSHSTYGGKKPMKWTSSLICSNYLPQNIQWQSRHLKSWWPFKINITKHFQNINNRTRTKFLPVRMQIKVSIQNCVQTAAISADTAHALHKAAFWCPPKGHSVLYPDHKRSLRYITQTNPSAIRHRN